MHSINDTVGGGNHVAHLSIHILSIIKVPGDDTGNDIYGRYADTNRYCCKTYLRLPIEKLGNFLDDIEINSTALKKMVECN